MESSGVVSCAGYPKLPEFDGLFVANGGDGTCRMLDGTMFRTSSR
jgi:hypothetical protein